MGQFGPSMRQSRHAVSADAVAYCLGVLVGASSSVAVLSLTVGSASQFLALADRYAIVAGVISILFAFDLARVLLGKGRFSCGLRRQTPYEWRRKGPIGVFGWGVDTGVPFTTYRATSLPLTAVALVCVGFGEVWFGLAYACGLIAGLFVGLRLPPPAFEEIHHLRGVREQSGARGTRLASGAGLLFPTALVLATCALLIVIQP